MPLCYYTTNGQLPFPAVAPQSLPQYPNVKYDPTTGSVVPAIPAQQFVAGVQQSITQAGTGITNQLGALGPQISSGLASSVGQSLGGLAAGGMYGVGQGVAGLTAGLHSGMRLAAPGQQDTASEEDAAGSSDSAGNRPPGGLLKLLGDVLQEHLDRERSSSSSSMSGGGVTGLRMAAPGFVAMHSSGSSGSSASSSSSMRGLQQVADFMTNPTITSFGMQAINAGGMNNFASEFGLDTSGLAGFGGGGLGTAGGGSPLSGLARGALQQLGAAAAGVGGGGGAIPGGLAGLSSAALQQLGGAGAGAGAGATGALPGFLGGRSSAGQLPGGLAGSTGQMASTSGRGQGLGGLLSAFGGRGAGSGGGLGGLFGGGAQHHTSSSSGGGGGLGLSSNSAGLSSGVNSPFWAVGARQAGVDSSAASNPSASIIAGWEQAAVGVPGSGQASSTWPGSGQASNSWPGSGQASNSWLEYGQAGSLPGSLNGFASAQPTATLSSTANQFTAPTSYAQPLGQLATVPGQAAGAIAGYSAGLAQQGADISKAAGAALLSQASVSLAAPGTPLLGGNQAPLVVKGVGQDPNTYLMGGSDFYPGGSNAVGQVNPAAATYTAGQGGLTSGRLTPSHALGGQFGGGQLNTGGGFTTQNPNPGGTFDPATGACTRPAGACPFSFCRG